MTHDSNSKPHSQSLQEVAENVAKALMAYKEFMEMASKLEKEEEQIFREKMKEYESKKIEDLRKKLMQI